MSSPEQETRGIPQKSAKRTQAPAIAVASPQKRISSAELLAGGREILIDHSGETYRLRHTSQGKLILTK